MRQAESTSPDLPPLLTILEMEVFLELGALSRLLCLLPEDRNEINSLEKCDEPKPQKICIGDANYFWIHDVTITGPERLTRRDTLLFSRACRAVKTVHDHWVRWRINATDKNGDVDRVGLLVLVMKQYGSVRSYSLNGKRAKLFEPQFHFQVDYGPLG